MRRNTGKPLFKVDRARKFYLVSAKFWRGGTCFCDGLKENEANELAEEWRTTRRGKDGILIIPSSVAVSAYLI